MIKLKRRIGSAFLACMMLLSLLPITALAAETSVNTVEELTEAISKANDGDTIKLAAGTYDLDGTLTIQNRVSLIGASEGVTTIIGPVVYQFSSDQQGETVTVQNLTIQSDADNALQGLQFRGNQPNDGYNLNIQVKNCTFKGWTYAVTMNSHANGYYMTISDCNFSDSFYACSYNYDVKTAGQEADNTLEFEGNNIISDKGFAVQKFSNSVQDNYNDETYETVKAFEDNTPTISGSVKYVKTAEELSNALTAAQNGDTIVLGANITLTENGLPGAAISGKTLTIDGKGNTISFKKTNNLTNGVFGNDNNPLYAGTKLTVKNLVIENTGDQAGYASIVGYDANGAEVTYEGCTFKNLYAAVYVNPITKNPENGGVTLSITGCKYEGTLYGYAKDSSGYQLTEVIFTGNTGDFSTGETVKQVVYAEVDVNGTIYTKAFDSIQGAVTAAKDGTTITVTPGTYDGDITIKKSLTIKGAENASSVLTGKVTINGANMDVTLDGLKFTHHEDAATRVNQTVIYAVTDNCKDTNLTVKNCVAENLGYSMFVYTMPNKEGSPRMGTITIDNNTVSNTEGNYTAFNLWGASKHVITNNTVSNIGLGAFNLSSTVGDVLFENNTIDNVGGCGLQIANYATGESVIVRDNNIAGAKDSGIRIYSDGEGKLSSTFEITDNAIENSGHAITFYNDGVPGHKSNITGVVKASGNTYNGEPVGVDFGNSDRNPVAVFYNGDTLVAQYIAAADGKVTTPAAPSRAGYSFRGWYGNGHLYAAGQTVQISKDTTFVAQWSDNTPYYTITVKDAANGTVTCYAKSAAKGADVTLNVKADVGYQLDKLTVTDASGKTVAVEKVNNTTYTFVMPGSKVTVEAVFVPTTVEPSGLPFTDVSTSDWFYSAVKFVYENGLMDGVEGNLFAPNATLNRAMAVTILYRLEGSPAVTTDAGFNLSLIHI